MQSKIIAVSVTCLLKIHLLIAQLQPIGQWREHLPYHQVTDVTTVDHFIFASTPFSIFSVDLTDNSLHRYNKITGLSETGISAMTSDSVTGKLIIAYQNNNIDILKSDLVKNVDAVKNSSNSGDLTIRKIFATDGLAFLCTNIGIIVIDEAKFEIKDTYTIGTNGNKVSVNDVETDLNYIYAASEEGLKQAPLTGSNLADYHNWQLITGNDLTPGPVQFVLSTNNTIVVVKNDSVITKQGTSWFVIYHDGWHIQSISANNSQLQLTETNLSDARIVVLSISGSVNGIIQNPSFIQQPRKLIAIQNDYWIADSLNGLIKVTGSSFVPYIPNSPSSVTDGEMYFNNGTLWVSSGSVTNDWVPLQNHNGLNKFSDNTWTAYNKSNIPGLDSFPDLITLKSDPRDGSVWAGSFGGGLLQLKNNSLVPFKQNSPLQSPPGMPGKFFVSGLAFDNKNNLWIANYGSNKELHVIKADGSWRSFTIPFTLNNNAVAQIIIDDYDQVWIASPGNGLICFNYGKTIDNPADDNWRIFKSGKGNGNLPDNNVRSIEKDKNGFVWVGTVRGMAVIQCTQEIFTNQNCEAVLPIVQQGSFNGFLFQNEQVQTIAVDGADRKWVGTKNGSWLITADAEKQVLHFTIDNSPLPDNNVKRIVIDGISGEVFFETSKGIYSYRGNATAGGQTNDHVLVFPNPVPPRYMGSIAIRGLVDNAIVKITELNGRLVYQTRALGGQAIWDGRDYEGRKISTGVYLVLVTDDSRKENLVTKIIFIN